MSTGSFLNRGFTSNYSMPQLSTTSIPDLQELNALAARGLVPMLDVEKQLFCHRLVRTKEGLLREGLSPRYTIMTLLGLRKFEHGGGRSPIDTESLYQSFARDIAWIDGVGDLGLLVWLTATFSPDRFEELFRRVDLDGALNRYADARQAKTMELSWFLTGLALAAQTAPKLATELTDLSVETYHLLQENQGEQGFFGHMSTTKSIAGLLRGRIGSFADQVYPIYALATFATAFHVDESLSSALDCASAICSVQGRLGQWWWLYDAKKGHVSSRYPVYSVHQHGMAPMCLFALQEAVGRSFEEPIYRGLSWIAGPNELGKDMRDISQGLIWRCICPKHPHRKYWDTAASWFRAPKIDAPTGELEVLFEDRPYELGWLLYAFGALGVGCGNRGKNGR